MKQILRVVTDMLNIVLAAIVLGGAYIYMNPGHAQQLIVQAQVWLATVQAMPTIGAADAILFVGMGCGLVSLFILFRRGRYLLRGPVTIRLIR